MKRTGTALLLLLALLLLASCARAPKPERVSEEELAHLRLEFPCNDARSSLAMSMDPKKAYPTFEKLLGIDNPYLEMPDFYAVVAIRMTEDDWYTLGESVQPFQDAALNEQAQQRTPDLFQIVWPVHDAVVEQVLWGGEDLEPGDTITLGFGADGYVGGMQLERCYFADGRYVCFLLDRRDSSFHCDRLFSSSKNYTYYLSDQDVLASMTSTPGLDECSGMYLDAFAERVRGLLPDAEITDPTPGVETE